MLERLSTYHFPSGGIDCYYHTSSVRNALDILEFNHLFGSFPSKVNDPNDLKISIVNLDKSPYLQSRAQGRNCAAIQEGVNKKTKEIMDKTYRFVCLAEASKVDSDKQSELRFWNEYADHFKGVRFTFRVDQGFILTPSPNDTFCRMISYDGRTATLDASQINNPDDLRKQIADERFLRCLCYSKSAEWASEYELRLGSTYKRLNLSMSGLTSREERFFVFNPSKLKEVVVGYDASPVDVRLLEQMLQGRQVPLRMALTDLRYKAIGEYK